MGKTTWNNFQKSLTDTATYIDKYNIKYKNKFWSSLSSIKKNGVNCVAFVSISMNKSGMTKKAYNFYCKDGRLKGSETKPFKNKKNGFSVKENINKKLSTCVKEGIVKPGDIVGAQKGAHTMVYRGKANGKYIFYSVGKSSLAKKKICNNARSGDYKVGVRIRPPYVTEVKKTTVKTVTASSKTAYLAIGHGKSTDGSNDRGCVYTKGGKTYTEAELMKPIVGSAVKYLKACGVTVYTDYPDNKINMVKQVAESNAKKVDIHVAVHCDYSKAPTGTLPLYTSSNGKKLATAMNKRVLEYSGMKTRGIGYRTDLYELNATTAPAVIFEAGSISKDLVTFQKKYDAIGKGIAHGICDYLGIEFKG